MLCMKGGELSVNKGDLLIAGMRISFCCALSMIIDFFSPVVDGVKDVLYPVFCQRYPLRSSHADL